MAFSHGFFIYKIKNCFNKFGPSFSTASFLPHVTTKVECQFYFYVLVEINMGHIFQQPYTYDLRTTLAVRGAGGCLTTKKGAWCGAVLARCGAFFVDIFHFLLLFVTFFTARKFYKLLFPAKTGVKFVTFCYFFYCL